ncbi:MAG: DUF2442 domain-containing protein [Candidatus Babeliales bacterium]|nr:DUF2442 domain-containing protein [Candidatus Babeliales bacterium]
MVKKLKNPGKNISNAEVENISKEGIWVLLTDQEFFLPFTEFPWFKKATIEQIYNLQLFHGKHLHWPSLDVDIDVESLKHLDAYPLKYS